jgi:hypothetical protein
MKTWSTDPLPKPELGKILVVRTHQEKGYIYLYYEPNITYLGWFNRNTGYYTEGDVIWSDESDERRADWQVAEFTP